MQMGMVKQILTPGVKNGTETDGGAEMLGVGRNGLQRLGGGPEENALDGPFVLQGDVGDLLRDRNDNVKILGLKKLGLSVFDPLRACQGLAFWTVTIRTRVEPDPLVATAVTHFEMTAQSGGAAHFKRGHDAPLCSRYPCAELLTISFAVAAENIRHFQLRTIHRTGCSVLLVRYR